MTATIYLLKIKDTNKPESKENIHLFVNHELIGSTYGDDLNDLNDSFFLPPEVMASKLSSVFGANIVTIQSEPVADLQSLINNHVLTDLKERDFQSAKAALVTQSIKRAIDEEMGLFEVNVVVYDDRNKDNEGVHIKHLSAGLAKKGEITGLFLIDDELNSLHGYHLTSDIIQAKEVFSRDQIFLIGDLLDDDNECAVRLEKILSHSEPLKAFNDEIDALQQNIANNLSPFAG